MYKSIQWRTPGFSYENTACEAVVVEIDRGNRDRLIDSTRRYTTRIARVLETDIRRSFYAYIIIQSINDWWLWLLSGKQITTVGSASLVKPPGGTC